ncbi:MAG: TrkH family potassium uptake protein [Kiritimatiellae bacterium]|nr:TrkH family potassium uptake protein [Kiritimatiellia bacterium]
MNIRAVFQLISLLWIGLSLFIASCWGVSIYYGDTEVAQRGLALSSLIALIAGVVLYALTRGPIDLTRRDGIGIVTFGWLAAALLGSLPYILSGAVSDPITALFETLSGFTTTGASALSNLEKLPKGILLWRCMTQWLGGMGVLVLCVAILPFLGVGGMQIYRAEMPGPSKDRLTPRITSTAKFLWAVYLFLTLTEALLLKLGGITWFSALCHSFATVSTGGFSIYTESIGAFNNMYIEVIITIFMFLAGINFALHYRALRGDVRSYFRDPEFRFFLLFWLGVSFFLTFNIWKTTYMSIGHAIQAAFFQSTSMITTTGFCTEDFNRWPLSSRILIVVLMFTGACAGSTSGGMKMVRIFVVFKKIIREIRLFMLPQAVVQIKLGRKPLDQDTESKILSFFIIFILLFTIASFAMSFYTPDLETATTSVIATLGNIGPGLNMVGPTENYGFIETPGKLILIICMLLGRLELYTVLVILLPRFWKR